MSEVKRYKRLAGVERERLAGDLRKRYEGGETIRELAASIGRSFGFVQTLLHESGAVVRSRGGAHRRRREVKPAA